MERDHAYGGSAGGGGYDFQAETFALVAAKMLAEEPLTWSETGCDRIPVVVASETGGYGDDLRVSLRSGITLEIQVKKGISRGDDLWRALMALARGVQADPSCHGVLLTNSLASATVRGHLKEGILRVGQGGDDNGHEIVADFVRRLRAEGMDPSLACRRLSIVVRDFESSSAGEEETLAALRRVVPEETEIAARGLLVQEGHDQISVRGARDLAGLRALLVQAGLSSLPRFGTAERRRYIPFVLDWPPLESFSGRCDELVELEQRLANGTAAARHLLSGLGGTGKSQLAIQHAHQCRDAYPGGVFWINGAVGWRSELARVASRAGLAPADPTDPDREGQLVVALARRLEEAGLPSLLIIDGVDAPHHVPFREVAPKLRMANWPGKVLVTSRVWDPPEGFGATRLVELAQVDARRLIIEKRPELEEHPLVDQVCEMLGRLPLALALASAALGKLPDMTLDAFVRHLRERGVDRLSADAGVRPEVANAVRVNGVLDWHWDYIENSLSREFLRLCAAYEEGAVIPIARLGLLSGLVDDGQSLPADRPVRVAADELNRANLASDAGRDAVRVHALVREYLLANFACAELLEQRAENLVAAMENPLVVLEQTHRRGWRAVLADLVETHGTIRTASPSGAAVGELTRVFELQGRLRGEGVADDPGTLVQQLREGARQEGRERLRSGCDAWLRGRPHLATYGRWRFVSDPSRKRVLVGHRGSLNSVAASRCGDIAMAASRDGDVSVWHMANGELAKLLPGPGSAALDVAIAPNGQRAAAGFADGFLIAWELPSGRPIWKLKGHRNAVNAVVFLDEETLVTGSSDRAVRVWDPKDGRAIADLRGHREAVLCICAGSGRTLVSGSADGFISKWNLSINCRESDQRVSERAITGVAFLAGDRVLCSSADGGVRLWDWARACAIQTYAGHEREALSVAADAQEDLVVSGGADCTLRVWRLTTGQPLRVCEGHSGRVNDAEITTRGTILSASWDQTLGVWDPGSASYVHQETGHRGWWVRGLSVLPDGRRLLSASSDQTVRLWDLETGTCLAVLKGHRGKVNHVAARSDGVTALSASADGKILLWDLAVGRSLYTLEGHESRVNVVLPVGQRLAVSGSWDRTIRLWDVESGRPLRVLSGGLGRITGLAKFSDRLVVSSDDEGGVCLWDLKEGQLIKRYESHPQEVAAVAVFPMLRRMVTASVDGSIRCWDAATGGYTELSEPNGCRVGNLLALGRDSVVSCSEDKAIRVWNVETGERRAQLYLQETPHGMAALGTNQFAVGTAGGSIQLVEYRD